MFGKVVDEADMKDLKEMKAHNVGLKHILNIFKEGELVEEDSVRKIGIPDFSTKPINYNLDVIISVGYRMKSK